MLVVRIALVTSETVTEMAGEELLDPPYTLTDDEGDLTLPVDSVTALTGDELLPLAWTVTVVWYVDVIVSTLV